MALNWQTLQLPLAAGLNQRADERALQPPALLECIDAQFDEIGGLQTRMPYAAVGTNRDISGSDLANFRRIVANGDELLLFTKDTLYSWNAQLARWVSKGTHMACKVEEKPKFVTTGDQVDCDRAELSNTIVYTWTDNTQVYAAAVDKTTGSVITGPTAVSGATSRAKLVALSTKILLFASTGTDLKVRAIDPAAPATGIASAATTVVSAATGFGVYYDVVKVPSADTAAFVSKLNPTTSYIVGTVTAGLVVTTSTKARTADGALTIAVDPTATYIQIFRVDGANIDGDLLTIALADWAVNAAIGAWGMGSTPSHITAAYRSTQDGGAYRCYVFYSAGSGTEYNYADTAGNLGTAATFLLMAQCASRAFEHDGHVYLWLSFTEASEFFSGGFAPQYSYALQNTYFLYRDDGLLVAKAAAGRAGDVASVSHLPTVQSLGSNVFTWCGVERHIISIGGGSARRDGYGARAPRDIKFEFDSNAARRCARLGKTLYITGGEILQYDGAQLTEVGFHIFPYWLALTPGAGSIANGTYAYRQTARWDNAQGEVDRSTTATHGQVTIAAGPLGVNVDWATLCITHKTNRPIAIETWRTAVNPTADAPFYLVSGKNPAVIAGANCYSANTTAAGLGTTMLDAFADSSITEKETSPENGGYLENLSPPPATIIIASADRLFLAGVAGDPDRIWYSKQRRDGEVASFHDTLTVSVPPAGGDITGLAFLGETLIVFRETAIYALDGDGHDNAGGGLNYGVRLLSADCGSESHEAIALTERGLIFKSSKGWYLLNKGGGTEYIGGPVADYDSEAALAVHALESRHEIRCLTASRMLVLDTVVGQWGERTIGGTATSATIWSGTYHYQLSDYAACAEQTTYISMAYGMDIETGWIKLSDLQGFGRVRRIMVLGEYRGAHKLRIRVARDYSTTYFDDDLWTPSPTTVGGPLQVKHGPSIQQCQAIKVRITVVGSTSTAGSIQSCATEGCKLTGIAFEVGLKPGLFRHLPAAQKQ
jgi:hypothetical protein